MRIAQLAPLIESCPPGGYGGTELIVSLLTEELVSKGHDVTLFASGDSITSAKLIPCSATSLRKAKNLPSRRWAAYELNAVLKVLQTSDRFDIIHNHSGFIPLPVLRSTGNTVVTTIHNPISAYCSEIFLACNEMPYVAISDAYRRLNYRNELNYVATIHNGIDVEPYSIAIETPSKDYLLFMGRVCSDKGAVEAIEIARQLEIPLVLAGKIDGEDREFFDRFVQPLLDPPNVEYIGEVSFDQKCNLYRNAVATVCPIKFDEPFGLVFAESLASGTPVMALNRGAAIEVVSDGETGILTDTIDELVKRFPEIQRVKSQTCRDRARLLFSKERMANEYESLYSLLRSPSLSVSGHFNNKGEE